jgi:hypothetical protein
MPHQPQTLEGGVNTKTTSALGALLAALSILSASAQPGFVPKSGFVPDSATALEIAEAVLVPIYGRDAIEREKPLKAELRGDVWTVTGTLPRGHVGGVATVRIAKADGRILFVLHGQ